MAIEATWPFDVKTFTPGSNFVEYRKKCPFDRVNLWNGDQPWLATRVADVREILRSDAFSSNAGQQPHASEAMSTSVKKRHTFDRFDAPYHASERGTVAREFTVKEVSKYREFIEGAVGELLVQLETMPQPVDIVTALANNVPALVTCELLGLPAEDASYLRDQLAITLGQASTPEEVDVAVDDLLAYFDRTIEDVIAEPRAGVASILVHDHMLPGQLNRDRTARLMFSILLGGFDSTSSMISLGTVLLLEYPDQLARLRSGEVPWPVAVEELVRYFSITKYVAARVAIRDVDINGTLIREGEPVIASVVAANWDPEAFSNPEVFDPARDARRHVGFGFGPHQCLGQHLARLDLQIVFKMFFERFPNAQLMTASRDLEYTSSTVHTPRKVLVNLLGVGS